MGEYGLWEEEEELSDASGLIFNQMKKTESKHDISVQLD